MWLPPRNLHFDAFWDAGVKIIGRPDVKEGYIGCTEGIKWRAVDCYAKENMSAHIDTFDEMWPISIQTCAIASAWEKVLQAKFAAKYPRKVHHTSYKKGPLPKLVQSFCASASIIGSHSLHELWREWMQDISERT